MALPNRILLQIDCDGRGTTLGVEWSPQRVEDSRYESAGAIEREVLRALDSLRASAVHVCTGGAVTVRTEDFDALDSSGREAAHLESKEPEPA